MQNSIATRTVADLDGSGDPVTIEVDQITGGLVAEVVWAYDNAVVADIAIAQNGYAVYAVDGVAGTTLRAASLFIPVWPGDTLVFSASAAETGTLTVVFVK
jgi:hypothetical protein